MAPPKQSEVWTYFERDEHDPDKACCKICHKVYSRKGRTTSSLKSHLKSMHPEQFSWLENPIKTKQLPKIKPETEDEDSNSSIKFSSEIWGHFEQEDSEARCTICQKTTENTVEEMKNHLEEDHPAILISILNKKSGYSNVDSDDETNQEEEPDDAGFTEIVYLEEELNRKTRNPAKRARVRRTLNVEENPRIQYNVIPHTTTAPAIVNSTESRPEIDSFLNYIGVLLKNVPKESFPKLQLDVISLILNAQMAQTSNCILPMTPNTSVVTANSDVSNGSVRVINNTGDYHITIESKDDQNT